MILPGAVSCLNSPQVQYAVRKRSPQIGIVIQSAAFLSTRDQFLPHGKKGKITSGERVSEVIPSRK